MHTLGDTVYKVKVVVYILHVHNTLVDAVYKVNVVVYGLHIHVHTGGYSV
jgi:hypothetical protein